MTNTDQARRGLFRNGRRAEPPMMADADAIRRIDAATDDIEGHRNMDGNGSDNGSTEPDRPERPDPAPSAPAIAEERATQLVANITTAMQGELRGLREQIDDLLRDLTERRALLVEAIRSHAEFAEAAIQHKIIIAESIQKLRTDFERSRTPLPPVRNV